MGVKYVTNAENVSVTIMVKHNFDAHCGPNSFTIFANSMTLRVSTHCLHADKVLKYFFL
jgi:hypothetical protein